jgi:uncharacterized protein (TIGR02147 family)
MSVFEFSDYRAFLHQAILERKKESPSFSFRFVAYRLGCNPGFFTRVIKGSRNLSPEHVLRLCAILKLGKKEREYFQLLVNYNQAKRQLEREHFYERLRSFKGSKIRRVSREQYCLYEQWYNVVLRELINIIPTFDVSDASCAKLASHFAWPVKAADIKKSMSRLLQSGILEKQAGGRLRLSDRLITTGLSIPQVIVQKVLRQFFRLGEESLERFKKDERVCATVTVSTSRQGYEQVKARLEQCRKEILEIVHDDPGELEQVYHLNMQLFPVTKSCKQGTKK